MNEPSQNMVNILDTIPDAVIALDKNCLFIFLNQKANALFNTEGCLLTGKQLFTEWPSFNTPALVNAFQKTLQTKQTVSLDAYEFSPKHCFQINIFSSSEGFIVFLKEINCDSSKAEIDDSFTQTAKKLQAEKELSDTIINSLPGIFYMADLTPKLLRWNKAFETISGYSSEEMKTLLPVHLFAQKDHLAFMKSMEEAYNKGYSDTEVSLISKNGLITPLYITGVKIDYLGEPAILGVGIDISEKRKAEEEIKKASERFALISMATNDMIWDWNLLTDEIWWNANYNKLFSYDSSANVYHVKVWVNSIHPDDRQRVEDGIYKVINSSESLWVDEYRCLKNDGTILHIYDRGYVSRDEEGKPYRMIGSMQNITERVQAQQALQAQEEKYRNIFERASDSIALHNMKGEILDVNFASADFSGYSKEELTRMKITDLLFAEDLITMPVPFERLMAGETTFNRRRVKTKTGIVRMMDVSSKMLPDGNVMAMIRDVTERNETEKALSNSELRFRTLAGNAPVGIFETNSAGQTVYANSKMTEYTGLSFDDLLGINWIESVHPEDRQQLLQEWKQNVDQKKESTSEYRIVDKSGNVKWLNGKAIPVYDKYEQHTGYMGTVFEVTKNKLALLALAASEEKYRSLVEQASDAIYIADTNGRIITVNSSACKLSGYSEEELLKMSVYEFLDPEDLESNPLRFEQLKQGATVTTERRLKRRDGTFFSLETTAKMLSDGRILVFARDISERIKAQNEILKEKKLSDAIINSLPGIFYLFAENKQLLRRNKNFDAVSGYTEAEILDMPPLKFFDPDDKEIVKKAINDVFKKGMAKVEANFLTKDKRKIPYYFSGWRIVFENKPCLIGVGIDITEKKKAEELLVKSYEDIRELASHLTKVREDERKRIGREIHDELGQQLTAIKMDVAWIDKKIPDETNPIKANLKNIIKLLDGSNQSVRRILTELSPGIVDNEDLQEAMLRQNRQFTASTKVPVEFTTTQKKIILSPEIANCIYRVYQESLTNIMRYAGAATVKSSLNILNGNIVLSIADDGKGFDTLLIPTKKSFGLLGMKERVLSQNGKFELISKKGKGTKIIVTIPYK